MEVSGQLHAPAALPQEKSPWYPLGRRLGGPQSRSEHCSVEKNFQLLLRLEQVYIIDIYIYIHHPWLVAE
jgi:hypothetical protein